MAIDKAAVLLAVIAVGSFLFVLAMIKYLIAHYDTRDFCFFLPAFLLVKVRYLTTR